MTTKEIATMIASLKIPYAYYQFPETAETTPFICFFYAGDNDFKADNANYRKIDRLVIELYTKNKDLALESQLEGVLAQNGLVWSRSEYYVDSERMYETIYETNVIIDAEVINNE